MGDTAFIRFTSIPTGLRIAQVIGLTSTAFLAGKTFTQTFSATPALLHAPAPLLARQWKTMFDSDKLLAPVIVVYSSAIFGWLAWREPIPLTSPSKSLHLTATTLLLATIPYSLLLLEPLTQSLEAQAAADPPTLMAAEVSEVSREQSTHWLVDRWATVNLGRAVMCALAAGSATWAGVCGTGIAGVRVVGGVEGLA